MDLHIKLKNYRCFGERPVEISFREGVTAILGPNNAGKSTIAKLFYCLRPLFERFRTSDVALSWCQQPQMFGTNYTTSSSFAGSHPEFTRWACRASNGAFEFELHNDDVRFRFGLNCRSGDLTFGEFGKVDGSKSFTIRPGGKGSQSSVTRSDGQGTTANLGIKAFTGELKDFFQYMKPLFDEVTSIIFLPAIRSAQPVQSQVHHYDLLYGVNLFSSWRQIHSSGDSNLDRRAFILEKSIAKVFGAEDLSIIVQQDQKSLLVRIDGEQFILEELGNGLAQFISIGITLLSQDPSYVFIDEPETGLHPQLQRSFIEFVQMSSRSGVVFSTHSVGLARAAADYLYLVARDKQKAPSIKEFVSKSQPGEFLGEMSFATYHELGCSCILLVEGRTDVAPIQHWIRQLGLDHEIVVFSLAGDEGIYRLKDELREYKRVCPNLAVIIDRETSSAEEPADIRRTELLTECDRQNVPCLLMEKRALENYFPSSAVQKVYGAEFQQLGTYERPYGIWPDHSKKRHNQALAAVTHIDDLAGTDLHTFLTALRHAANV